MRIDTTDQRQSKYIVGILIITVFAICVAIVFGCGGYLRVKQDNYNLINSNFSLNLIEGSSGNEKIVTVAQGTALYDLDTEVGYIEGLGEVLPNWEVVPLCITDELLAPYWVTIKSVGGYKPYGNWFIDIFQDAKELVVGRERIGQIALIYTEVPELSGSCYTVYNITFDVVGECISVDSNNFPDFPPGWVLTKEVYCTPDLNKKVDIEISTYWYGCGEPYQRFELILSQKIVFPESPNSRM